MKEKIRAYYFCVPDKAVTYSFPGIVNKNIIRNLLKIV